MGLMTFAEFKDEVALNLGGEASPVRLGRWVNWGYLNLGTYVVLEELRDTAALSFAEDVDTFALPSGLVGILTVELGGRKLRKIRRLYSNDNEDGYESGQPLYYLRRGTELLIQPPPDELKTGVLEYMREPTPLSANSDVTEIPSYWDVGIVSLGTHYGHLSLGHQDEADRWLGRFLGYASSRKTNRDVESDARRGGVTVALEAEDLLVDDPES